MMTLFDRFYGNDSILGALVFFKKGGRFPHALLFEGAAGIGKKTLGKLTASLLLCGEDEPCGRCGSCVKIQKDIHPDVQVIRPDGRSFKKEQIEKIRSDAYIKPNEAGWKIYILAEAQHMTNQAQNALLKILEEPPKNVLFILTCDNKFHLLPTVLSRVTAFSVLSPDKDDRAAAVRHLLPDTGEEEIKKAVESTNNIGQALAFLTDDKARQTGVAAEEISAAIMRQDLFAVLESLARYEKDREGLLIVLEKLKDLLIGSVKNEKNGQNDAQWRILPLQVLQVVAIIKKGEAYARQNMSMTLLSTWLGAGIQSALEIDGGNDG